MWINLLLILLIHAPAPFSKCKVIGTWEDQSGNIIATFHSDHTYEETWYHVKIKGVWSDRRNGDIVVQATTSLFNKVPVVLKYKLEGSILRLPTHGKTFTRY